MGPECRHERRSLPVEYSVAKEPPELPNNFVLADQRLQSLRRRLLKDKALHRGYTAEMGKLLSSGYAEPVTTEAATDGDRLTGMNWYLPHHPVLNVNKPGKLRVVFDCAAEYGGVSLNKKVLQGPDLTNKLLGVITRFREDRIAFMSDIEAMFHQVRVPPGDRDALRFLWWTGGDLDKPPDIYRMTVHLFGGVWSPSCANYALRRTAQDQQECFDPEVVRTVMDNFYVDDCLKSVATEDGAVLLVKQLCQLLSRGGFRLTKWTSNSKLVLDAVPPDERAHCQKNLDLDQSVSIERALGVLWNTDSDKFGIKIKPVDSEDTRRGVLKTLSSVYDPLGFVCPFVLRAKLIF